MFSRILVCLEGSTVAEEVVPYAHEIARRFGSSIVLLTAIEIPTPMSPELAADIDQILEFRRTEAQRYLDAIAPCFRQDGIAVQTAIAFGSPGNAIAEYAGTNGIDLIAMGTHGRKNIGRLVFGSVADYVMRRTAIPVLAVKPKENAEKFQPCN